LSPGFCATVFADNIGHARHLLVSPSGVVYVNTWSGRYYNEAPIPDGGFLIAFQDTKKTGKADVVTRFGVSAAAGAAGGTGIALYQGALYAEVNDSIVCYAFSPNSRICADDRNDLGCLRLCAARGARARRAPTGDVGTGVDDPKSAVPAADDPVSASTVGVRARRVSPS
jgi:hypothetical protein